MFQKGHKPYKHRNGCICPFCNKNHKFPIGDKHFNWKGDKAGYSGIHKWIRDHYGRPKKCEICGSTNKKIYHWANISRKYKRDISDWKRLCVRCHMIFDNRFEQRGESNKFAKLKNVDIKRIRKLYATGKYTHQDIANIFCVNRENIGHIVRKSTWTHI